MDKKPAPEKNTPGSPNGCSAGQSATGQSDIFFRFAEATDLPVIHIGLDGNIHYTNPAAQFLRQSKQGLLLSEKLRCCVDPRTAAPFQCSCTVSTQTFMLSGFAADRDNIFCILHDITDLHHNIEELKLFANVFDNTIEGIIITDADGTIERANDSFSRVTGYSRAEVIGHNPRLLKSNRHDQAFYNTMWGALVDRGRWQGEIWNRRKNDDAYLEWLSITALKNAAGHTTHYIGVFHDITDIKNKEQQIKYQANHDPLTDLPNRLLFIDRLHVAINRARRSQTLVAIMFLDLDNFKTINDSLGHAAGDKLLIEAAKRIADCLRSEDTVARFGGDEFVIILTQLNNAHDAVRAAKRIITSINAPADIAGHELHVGASIGITYFPNDGNDAETLIKNADIAMYKAKDQGRNCCELFTSSMNTAVVKRMTIERNLRLALERHEFDVFYQPRVDLASGLITGMEALIRWKHPEQGLISPADFIPLAEETGLITRIGQWVLQHACRQTRVWHNQGYDCLKVSVNLSPRQFAAHNLLETVQEALTISGLPPQFLELEITEGAVMHNVKSAIVTLCRLSEMGIHLSLDDFGTGYSSLAYLKEFPLNALKIDRSFVADIPHHADDIAITKAILTLAHSLNLKAVAEGVETEKQYDFMTEQGCDEIQGYYFSRPLEHAAFSSLLEKHRKK